MLLDTPPAIIAPGTVPSTSGLWEGKFEVFKFQDDDHYLAWLRGDAQPYETIEAPNTFLLTGINELWRLATGASANTLTQANTQIGVGDSTTAASSAQTDLQAATNKTYVTADVSGGITTGANGGTTNTLIVQATFDGTHGNYAWQEMVVKQSVSGICLNRAVQNLGTKASGTTWVAKCTLSIT